MQCGVKQKSSGEMSTWLSYAQPNHLGETEVHLWVAPLDVTPEKSAHFRSLLSRDEQERAGRFHKTKDARRYEAARGSLRSLLGAYLANEPDRLRFAYDAFGKPHLAGELSLTSVNFSISHSNDWGLFGFVRGHKIGVDLERISTERPYMAVDADNLKRIFEFTRKLLVDRIQVAFLSPWPDRASLAGKTVHFSASLVLPSGLHLTSNEAVFGTPQMGLPLFSGRAGQEELSALNTQMKSSETGWLTLLRPVFVFLGLGGLLLVAWFWIPRLVWPGQYIGSIAALKPAGKWASPTRPGQRPVQVVKNLPPGFAPGKAGVGQRTPQDATVVQPSSETGKIRLHRDFRR